MANEQERTYNSLLTPFQIGLHHECPDCGKKLIPRYQAEHQSEDAILESLWCPECHALIKEQKCKFCFGCARFVAVDDLHQYEEDPGEMYCGQCIAEMEG